MPFCPTCNSEYRPGIQRCAHCAVDLVADRPEGTEDKSERLRQAVEAKEAAPLARASYAEACQMVEALHAGGVDAMVMADPNSCGKGGHCSHFFVAVLKEDVQVAAGVLHGEWKRLIDRDESEVDADHEAVVDFDAEGAKACPACGTKFEGTPEECPDCGLYLGVG